MQYEILDIQTKQVVRGPYASLYVAQRIADKLDAQYSAVRYVVRRCVAPTGSDVKLIGLAD